MLARWRRFFSGGQKQRTYPHLSHGRTQCARLSASERAARRMPESITGWRFCSARRCSHVSGYSSQTGVPLASTGRVPRISLHSQTGNQCSPQTGGSIHQHSNLPPMSLRNNLNLNMYIALFTCPALRAAVVALPFARVSSVDKESAQMRWVCPIPSRR